MNRIILLGDSITAGVIDGFPSTTFTHKLQAKFPQSEFINRGVPGDNTKNAQTRLQADVFEVNPQVVLIFFGTNDAATTDISLEDYKDNLKKMIDMIGSQKVILVTPGLADETLHPDRLDQKMAAYALATREVAHLYNIPLVDWNKVFLLYKENKDQLLQGDGIHYSSEAYDLLVETIAPVLKEKLAGLNSLNLYHIK